jgi:hypothetical protein
MGTRYRSVDLSRALLDPASIFESPDELLRLGCISNDLKVEILSSWAYDASELAVAEEEGMDGGEGSCIEPVMEALDGITGGFDSEHVGPTKHGGFCVRAQRVGSGSK